MAVSEHLPARQVHDRTWSAQSSQNPAPIAQLCALAVLSHQLRSRVRPHQACRAPRPLDLCICKWNIGLSCWYPRSTTRMCREDTSPYRSSRPKVMSACGASRSPSKCCSHGDTRQSLISLRVMRTQEQRLGLCDAAVPTTVLDSCRRAVRQRRGGRSAEPTVGAAADV